jgi:hypothetical protein
MRMLQRKHCRSQSDEYLISKLKFERKETYGIINKIVSQALEDFKKRGKKIERKDCGKQEETRHFVHQPK